MMTIRRTCKRLNVKMLERYTFHAWLPDCERLNVVTFNVLTWDGLGCPRPQIVKTVGPCTLGS